MSWRSYVFLHRIHPHSILIGIVLLHRKKKRERTEVRGGMNHEGVEGGDVLLWVSILTSPAMPSYHRGLHSGYTPTQTVCVRALRLALSSVVRRCNVFVLNLIEQRRS